MRKTIATKKRRRISEKRRLWQKPKHRTDAVQYDFSKNALFVLNGTSSIYSQNGGGLPIGAVLMTAKVAEHMGPGTHGSTFGGNPVVCAGALAVLDAMDEAFMDNVLTQAARLRTGLKTLPHVTEVSGLGLMVVIAFEDGIKAADVRAACEKEGLLVLTAKTRLRLLPPLILTEADVDTALDTLRTVLEKF